MIDKGRIRGVIFDYGGTIDSNGVHWAEVIWQVYQSENMPVTKESFREAYIHGERTLGKNPIIKPHHTFKDMMCLKIDIQFEWLKSHLPLSANAAGNDAVGQTGAHNESVDRPANNDRFDDVELKHRMADVCDGYARAAIAKACPVLEWLADNYRIALVSNFYGNLSTVLRDFGLDCFFPVIIESAVVGVRKPDPQIFRIGVDTMQLQANEVVVIGDSYDKDIVPAAMAGCQTIWLKKTGWNNDFTGTETADLVITDFVALRDWL